MDTVTRNTVYDIKAALQIGKRTLKAIAAECALFEAQVQDDASKAVFARLADCKTRKQFNEVIKSL